MNNRAPLTSIDDHQPSVRLMAPLCLLLLVLLTVVGCQSAGPKAVGSPDDLSSGTIATNLMQLREGDVLRITFENVTNLNATLPIPLDGSISLQLVGQVKVSGKTVAELQTSLIALYEPHIKSTEITVMRISSAASYTVSGAVARPGKLPLERPLTVLEAVMEAGGVIAARAKVSDVSVFRIENGKRINYQFDLKKALRGEEPSLFYIKPFDVIYIPEKTFNF